MDDIGKWNSYIQRSLMATVPHEKELILTLTVPLEASLDFFRIGWDLKRPGNGRFIAMTTGRAEWNRRRPLAGAEYMVDLIEECNRLLEPIDERDRR